MGGTFDPIHHGHLLTAEEALWQFELDEVLFLPTGQPWMKENREVSPPRDGPTYTVETLREIRDERGGDVELFFITGADAILEIFQWKDPEEALALAHFIAATRPGYDLAAFEQEAPTRHPGISAMTIPALAISSTDIRERVRRGVPIRYLVPEGVLTYIEKAHLYR